MDDVQPETINEEIHEISNIQKGKKKSSFANDVFKLATGTAISQAIGFLLSPIVSRIYSPSDFGLFASFSAIAMLIGSVACLRYEQSIMLPKSDDDAANQFGISVFFSIIIGSIISLIIILFKEPLLSFLNIPDLSNFLWLLPITIILQGIFLALNFWNTRSKKFLRLSVAQINKSSFEYVTKIGYGFAGMANSAGLIYSYTIGIITSAFTLGYQIWRDDAKKFINSISWKKMKAGIIRYKKFPLINTWGALLASFSQQTPTFILTMFFSSSITGYYNLGFKTIRLPISLIGNAISQVFFQRATEAKREGNLGIIVEETFAQLITFGLYPMLILTIIGRELFIVVFGNNWAEAGTYSQILSIWTFFVLISVPMGTLFSVLEKQELGFYFNLALTISRIITLVIGGLLNNVYLALILFSITGSIFYLYLLLRLCSLSGLEIKKVLKKFFAATSISMPFLVIVLIVKLFITRNALLLSCIGLVMGIAYYIYIFYTNPSLKMMLFNTCNNIFRKMKS
jgi:O-antigen/teichoic acid export membrane protein